MIRDCDQSYDRINIIITQMTFYLKPYNNLINIFDLINIAVEIVCLFLYLKYLLSDSTSDQKEKKHVIGN